MIHYANGDEELYHIKEDPYEWHNLAQMPAHNAKREMLRKLALRKFSEAKKPSFNALPSLPWVSAKSARAPASKPVGGTFTVTFANRRKQPVEIFWMDRKGSPISYGTLAPGKQKGRSTRPGAVWRITDAPSGKELGHVTVGDRSAKVIIPATDSASKR